MNGFGTVSDVIHSKLFIIEIFTTGNNIYSIKYIYFMVTVYII